MKAKLKQDYIHVGKKGVSIIKKDVILTKKGKYYVGINTNNHIIMVSEKRVNMLEHHFEIIQDKPKIRAWKYEDDIVGLKVQSKNEKTKEKILIFHQRERCIMLSTFVTYTYEEALAELIQTNGEPCGVKL